MYSKFKVFLIGLGLALGGVAQQGIAMEQQLDAFDLGEFTDYLLAIDSYEEFKEFLQERTNQPGTVEDKIYSALYIAARYGLENEKSVLDKHIIVNLPNEKISLEKENTFLGEYTLNTQKLWQALQNAYYIAHRSQHWDWCLHIAQLLARFDATLDQEISNCYLRTALQHNDMALFEALLAVTQDINALDNQGMTILSEAITGGNVAAVKIVCKHGAKVTIPFPSGDSSLRQAYSFYQGLQQNKKSTSAYEDIIAELLAQPGINIAEVLDNDSKKLALHAAVEIESVDAVKALLSNPSIDVNCKALYNFAPLHFAINHDHEEIVKLLLSHPTINPNCCWGDDGNTALHLAADNGFGYVMQQLIKHKGLCIHEVNKEEHTALDAALMRVHSGYDDSGSLLGVGLVEDMHSCLALLLRFGAIPRLLSDNSPLSKATAEVLSAILPPAFVYALRNPSQNALSNYHIDAQEQDQYDATLLMYLVATGKIEAVKYILELGAHPYVLDCYGNSAISIVHTLIEQRKYAIVELGERLVESQKSLEKYTLADEKGEIEANIVACTQRIQNLQTELASYQKILTLLEDAAVDSVTKISAVETPSTLRRLAMQRQLNQDVTYLDTLPTELLLLVFGTVFGNRPK